MVNAGNVVRIFVDVDSAKAESSLKRLDRAVIGMSVAGIAAMGALAGASLKAAVDFESSFAGVRKTVDATEEEFAQLAQGFRDLAKEIPINVNEINRIGEAAGQLGIKTENILGFTRVMADLGVATNLSSDQAATALARLANITQMPQTEFDRLGSTVVALGNNLATTESEIVDMGLRLAGAGKQIGLTEAQTLGLAAALSSVGIEAQAGGTALSKVMIDIASEVANAGDRVEMFAKVAGMTADEFTTKWQTDAAGALVAFVTGLGNMESQGSSTLQVLEDLGITEVRMRDALLRASGAGDLLTRSIQIGTEAWEENTALTKEAEQRYSTTASQIQLLKNEFNDAAISLGKALIPALRGAIGAASEMTKAWSSLPSTTQNLALGFTALTIALPAALSLISGLSRMFTIMTGNAAAAGTATQALTLKIRAMVASTVIGALIVGLSLLAAKFDLLGGGTDKAAEAAERFGRALKLNADTAAFAGGQLSLVDVALREATKALAGWEEGSVRARFESAGMAKQIEGLALGMKAADASAEDLKEVYDSLPPAFQEVFDKTVGLTETLADLEEMNARVIRGWDAAADAMTGADLAVANAKIAVENMQRALESSKSPLDTYIHDLGLMEDGTWDADTATRRLNDSIDLLAGAFSATHPEMIALRLEHIKLTEEADELRSRTGELTKAEKARLEQLETKLIPANEKARLGFESNQKAVEDYARELQILAGPEAVGLLMQSLSDLGVAQERQIDLLHDVGVVLNTLATEGVPDSVDAWQKLKDTLSPEEWNAIADAVGPEFMKTIEGALTGTERDSAIAAGLSLGGAIAAAIRKGIGTLNLDSIISGAVGSVTPKAISGNSGSGGSFPSVAPAYAKGLWDVPGPRGAGDIFPALLSPGEMVIPAGPAERIRQGGAGATFHAELHFHGPADAESMRRGLDAWWDEKVRHELSTGAVQWGVT